MKQEFDNAKLKNVAGAFATGITVVTIVREDGSVQGMTANSFLSVSLDPPMVAFSIRNQSSMFPHLKEGMPLGISILSEQQQEISNHFAGRKDASMEVQLQAPSKGIRIVEGCIAWYSTVIEQLIPAGDHFLILCTVIDLNRSDTGMPLLYYGGYQRIAS